MKNTLWILLVILSSLTVTGCDGTQVFHADFQSDTLGSPPALSPAGPPAGDSITIVGPGSTRVVEWLGQTGTRAAEIASVPPVLSGMELRVDPGTKGLSYLLVLNIYNYINNETRDFFIRARTYPFNFGLLTEMKFRDGNIYVNNGVTFQLLGDVPYAPEDVMLVTMNVDFETETYDVAVFNSDLNVTQSVSDIPFINGGSGSTEPYFEVGYDGPYSGLGLPGMFVTDNFNISKIEP